MWRESDDWDYNDERQSRSYPRLAGTTPRSARSRPSSSERIIPELSQLSDEEFHQRLIAMRRKHAETMALCDEIGLHEREHSANARDSSHMPIARVDLDYTMSTEGYGHRSPPRSADYMARSFRSSHSPPTTRRTQWHESGQLDEATRAAKGRKQEMMRRRVEDEENMRIRGMQKYVDENVEFDSDRDWDSCSVDGCRPASSADHYNHSSQQGILKNRRFSPHPIRSSSAHNSNNNNQQWQNRITIPKPFRMTVREETNPPQKSQTVKEYERQLAERRWREERNCNYKFKALPLPANTYLPMYEALKEKDERRRTGVHAQRYEMLKAMQEPFSFDDRERHKKIVKHSVITAHEEMDKMPNGEFKAKPFPRKLFDETTNEKMREEEERRRIEAEQRADYMLRTSYLNPNMKIKLKGHKCCVTEPRDHMCSFTWNKKTADKVNGHHCDAKRHPHHHHDHGRHGSPNRSPHRGGSPSGLHNIYDDIGSDGEVYGRSSPRWPSTNLGATHLSRSYTDLSSGSSGYSSPSPIHRNRVYRNQMTAEMEWQLEQFEAEERRRQEQRKIGNVVTGAKLLTTTSGQLIRKNLAPVIHEDKLLKATATY